MSKEYKIDTHEIFDFGSGWLGEGTGKLFYELFNRLPSMREVKYKVNREFLEDVKQQYQHEEMFDLFDYIYYEDTDNEKEEEQDGTTPLQKEECQCYIVCKKNLLVKYTEGHVSIAYSDIDEAEIAQLKELGNKHRRIKDELNNLFVVIYEHNYYSLKQSHINHTDIKIDHHYNDDFMPIAQNIETFLTSDNSSGLVILHGKQGTGKTSYIRYLLNQGKKKMLYMSGDLVEKLSDPSFISFIRRQNDSIFIVEDCEELLATRNGSNRMNSGLINILNISDGLLSDELCIKFICTFNAPLKDIDEALLRKGRLVARYEFSDLAVEKVNKLIKEEGLDIPEQNKPMSLAELYNYEGKDFTLGRKKVGF